MNLRPVSFPLVTNGAYRVTQYRDGSLLLWRVSDRASVLLQGDDAECCRNEIDNCGDLDTLDWVLSQYDTVLVLPNSGSN